MTKPEPMTKAEAEAALRGAFASISVALALLEPHLPFFERFEKEARDLESFGHIVDPSLFKKVVFEEWRGDVRAILKAAHRFVGEAGGARRELAIHRGEQAEIEGRGRG